MRTGWRTPIPSAADRPSEVKILVTGAAGGLGSQFMEQAARDYKSWDFSGLTREQADLASPPAVIDFINRTRPAVILHAAAMTGVDLCESEPELAHKINVEGTRAVAEAATQCGSRVVYISSDYVFDGTKSEPYNEADTTNPLGVYGKTKFGGEKIVRELENHLIVRTSWLYGKTGTNFIRTMLRLAKDHSEVKVVTDQVGAPTCYPDLARALAKLIELRATGIINVANSGYCSWIEFAKVIFEEKNIAMDVLPVTSKEFNRPAPRPANSRLDCSRFEQITGGPLPHWRDALRSFLKNA